MQLLSLLWYALKGAAEPKSVMEGLSAAARIIQSAEFLQSHERLLDRPAGVPIEILDQLKSAAKVPTYMPFALHKCYPAITRQSACIRIVRPRCNLLG